MDRLHKGGVHDGILPTGPASALVSFDGAVRVASGVIEASSEQWQSEPLSHGLKLIIVGQGGLICKLPNLPQAEIVGPCLCAVWNQGDHEGMQSFVPGNAVPYTIVTLSPSVARRHVSENFTTLRGRLGMDQMRTPRLTLATVPRSLHHLCSQILTCPLRGPARSLFLSGKGLEVAAYALAALDDPDHDNEPILTSSDLGRVQQARDIVADRLASPPSVPELGLLIGLNARKLTAGFSRLFGCSVPEYTQSLRLQKAYQLLSETGASVSSVAYQIGYSPAHFSVAFRKRYGVSPKSIKGP